MRIRKRVPPPSPPPLSPPSSASPSPSSAASAAAALISSDPKPINPTPPRLFLPMLQISTKSSDNPAPPDQGMMIGSANPRWGFLTRMEITRKRVKDGEQEEDQKESFDLRKDAELDTGMHLGQTFYPCPSSTADDDDGKMNVVLPLKKRKEMSFDESNHIINMGAPREYKEDDDMDPKVKCKTNKKCVLLPLQNEPQQEEMKQGGGSGTDDGKMMKMKGKKVRGTEIMEGSRCSRVNGRGWRCWQQTMVGYSLCEHHLGKGRLRNSSSNHRVGRITNQQIGIAPKTLIQEEKGSEICRGDDEGEMKISEHVGVKARSISSLLGQTNN